MNIKEELKNRANFFFFSLADHIQEKSPELDLVRMVARKYQNKKELAKDKLYRSLVKRGIILGVEARHNIVVTAGRTVFARRMAGDTTYTGEIDYGAIGNGVSPSFTNASTQLSNEVFRKQAASQAYNNNIAYIDWFIASGDVADGTYTEFGSFIDGTASANSGQAFSLFATGGWVKSGSMFISAMYTIS